MRISSYSLASLLRVSLVALLGLALLATAQTRSTFTHQSRLKIGGTPEPTQTRNYKRDEAKARHIGPTAQDFRTAFGLGNDVKHFATVGANGVALLIIQRTATTPRSAAKPTTARVVSTAKLARGAI